MASINRSERGRPVELASPRMSKTWPPRAGALDLELVEQAPVDVALAGLVGHQVPQVADLRLADAVDAPEALLQPVGVPGQVVVDHEVGALEVDALAGGIGGDQHVDRGVVRKASWALLAVLAAHCRRG
jgi:hypothetical protein